MIEQRIRADQVELQVAASQAHGRPVILLHGVARRWQDFAQLFPTLAWRTRVLALDLRGHGGSGRASDYAVVDYVSDITSFLDRHVTEPAVLIGHSLGAMVAAAAAAARPALVRAVVLEDPPFGMMEDRLEETFYRDLFVVYRELAGSQKPVEELVKTLAEVRIVPHGRTERVRLADLRDAASLRFAASCLRYVDPEVFTPILEGRWLRDYHVEETLSRIACPTLWLQADFAAGGVIPDDVAAPLIARIPNLAHVRLAGVGHNIHASEPATMARMVSEFLESLD